MDTVYIPPCKRDDYLPTLATFLIRHDVPHCFVGGVAMQFYGLERETADVDVLLDLQPEHEPVLYEMVSHLGVSPPGEGFASWTFPEFRSLHRKPGKMLVCQCLSNLEPDRRLDIIMECASPLDARRIIERALEFRGGSKSLVYRVAQPKDVLDMKRQSLVDAERADGKRAVDRSDIEYLEALLAGQR